MVQAPRFREIELYTSGSGGYHTYRIPALVTTASGSLLAFCEGRRDGPDDHGKIDIVLRRSTDAGTAWEEQRARPAAKHSPEPRSIPQKHLSTEPDLRWILMIVRLSFLA